MLHALSSLLGTRTPRCHKAHPTNSPAPPRPRQHPGRHAMYRSKGRSSRSRPLARRVRCPCTRRARRRPPRRRFRRRRRAGARPVPPRPRQCAPARRAAARRTRRRLGLGLGLGLGHASTVPVEARTVRIALRSLRVRDSASCAAGALSAPRAPGWARRHGQGLGRHARQQAAALRRLWALGRARSPVPAKRGPRPLRSPSWERASRASRRASPVRARSPSGDGRRAAILWASGNTRVALFVIWAGGCEVTRE